MLFFVELRRLRISDLLKKKWKEKRWFNVVITIYFFHNNMIILKSYFKIEWHLTQSSFSTLDKNNRHRGQECRIV